MKLNAIIEKICKSIPSERELIFFIDICVRLSKSYLRYKEFKGYKICETVTDKAVELENLAVDSIGELFERNSEREYIQLRKYFIPYLQSVSSNDEWLILLRRLITSKTEQALFRIFRERDPQTARVIKDIKVTIRRLDQYSLLQDSGKKLIVNKNYERSQSSIEVVNDVLEYQILIRDIHSVLRPGDTIPVILKKIFIILDDNQGYPNAIEIGDVAYIIRTYRKSIASQMTIHQLNGKGHIFERLVHQDLVQMILTIKKNLFAILDKAYLNTGKLDKTIVDGFKVALADMIEDMTKGNKLDTHYNYIHAALPNIEFEEYDLKLRKKFEYILRQLRMLITEKVKKNSGG